MFKSTLKRLFFRAEGQEEIGTRPDERASFTLLFGELKVGSLDLRDGIWEFRYSPEFRAQVRTPGGLDPLVDFPDPDRVYRSDDLWPFFIARIPSVAQPQVLAEIQRRGLDQRSAPQLLRAFGERSIANPFLLRAS
jgi:hypothetical protein